MIIILPRKRRAAKGFRAKPNRWLRRHPPARGARIRDSCKPQYVLRSTWYRRPSWSFKSMLTHQEIDERYAQWRSQQIGHKVDVIDIVKWQSMRIKAQMKPLLDEFYSASMMRHYHG